MSRLMFTVLFRRVPTEAAHCPAASSDVRLGGGPLVLPWDPALGERMEVVGVAIYNET
jgi:hypothetical protein